MDGLAFFFFGLAPFALFCSGFGLVACPICLILGFLCKYSDKLTDNTPKIKLPPKEFWEHHYLSALGTRGDTGAREWANTVCGYHNAPIPSASEQEVIARKALHAIGTKTDSEKKAEENHITRVQYAKWYYMKQAKEKYNKMSQEEFEDEWQKHGMTKHWRDKEGWRLYLSISRTTLPEFRNIVDECYRQIYVGNLSSPLEWWLSQHLNSMFGVGTEEEVWNKCITQSEKAEGKKWVDECIERIWQEERERALNNNYTNRDYCYFREHGFNK